MDRSRLRAIAAKGLGWPPDLTRRQVGLFLMLAGSLLVCVYYARTSSSLWPVLIPWLVSLGAAVTLVRGRAGGQQRPWAWLNRNEALALAGLTLLAALLRLPGLERLPGGIYGDEGEFGTLALEVTEGNGPAPFGLAFFGDPALYVHVLAPFVALLGPTMEAVRLPSALVGTATVPVLYALARDLYGRGAALLAALFLATSAVHIHFSRLAVNVVWVPFFACLSLWLLKRGLDRRDDTCLLLAGIVGGIGFYSHFGARLIAPILLLLLVCQLIFDWRDRRRWMRAIVLAALGGLLALAPLLAHQSNEPGELTEHAQRRAIWTHWDDLAERYGAVPSDKLGILWEQVRRTAGGFVTRSDPMDGAQYFAFMDESVLNRVLGPLALLGIVALCFRLRRLDAELVLIWFFVPVVFASVLTDVVGQAHRLVHPLLPALIAAAFLIDWLIRLIRSQYSPVVSVAGVALVVLVTIAPGFWDTYRYIRTDVTDHMSPAGTVQARCMEALPDGSVALVVGAPRIYAQHGPSRYLGHDVVRRDLRYPSEGLPMDTGDRSLVILVHEGKRDTLAQIQAVYPDAPQVEIERPAGRRVLTVLAVAAPGDSAEALLNACARNANS